MRQEDMTQCGTAQRSIVRESKPTRSRVGQRLETTVPWTAIALLAGCSGAKSYYDHMARMDG